MIPAVAVQSRKDKAHLEKPSQGQLVKKLVAAKYVTKMNSDSNLELIAYALPQYFPPQKKPPPCKVIFRVILGHIFGFGLPYHASLIYSTFSPLPSTFLPTLQNPAHNCCVSFGCCHPGSNLRSSLNNPSFSAPTSEKGVRTANCSAYSKIRSHITI